MYIGKEKGLLSSRVEKMQEKNKKVEKEISRLMESFVPQLLKGHITSVGMYTKNLAQLFLKL